MEVYKKILSDGEINFEVNQPAHEDLLRIGLLVNRNSKLQIANPIYRVCFDENWVNEKLILIINNQSITVATENSPEANIPHPNPQEPETMQPNKQPKSKNPNKVLSLIRQIINTYIISPLKFLRPVWENFLASTSHYLILPIVAIVAILYNFCRLHYQDIFNFIKNKIKYIIVTICILGLISFIIITQIHINPIDPKLIAQIDQDVDKSTKKFNTEQIEGLKLALTAGQKLEEIRKKQNLNKITDYPTVKPIYALHKIENEIYQSNQIDGIPKEVRIYLVQPEINSFCRR
ncbi:MAG: hypothetical protein KA716_15250 [Gloeotrichia echinulata DEX184]|nr:hypothetical protein [Gloeotrichia echinulata DEX184]